MFGLFRRTRSRAGSQGRVSLRLESLEWRDQPDATPVSTLSPIGTTTPVTTAPLPAPPAIVGLEQEQINSGLFLVSGTVVDANPGGLVVTFGGAPGASGQTATTNADGSFSGLVQLSAGTASGTITATTVDGQGLSSQPIQALLNSADAPPPAPAPAPGADAPPAIVDFEEEEVGNGLFLISGTVVDANPGSLVVTFGGGTSANGKTTTTNADGSFDCTIQLRTDGTDSGFLTATTVDGQGLVSQPVQVFLDPTPP